MCWDNSDREEVCAGIIVDREEVCAGIIWTGKRCVLG